MLILPDDDVMRSATDDEVLSALQSICRRLGQSSYDTLPLAQPEKVSCVFGCALNGAVTSIATFGNRKPNYTYVDFTTSDPEAAEVLVDELDGELIEDDIVRVMGATPLMRWMFEFDEGKKPHLIADETDDPIRREWTTFGLAS